MNPLRVALLLLSLCALFLAPIYSFAETSAGVTAQIQKSQSLLAKKREALDTVENRLKSYEVKKSDAMSQLIRAKADLAEAKRELDRASKETGENSEHKQDLAQRMYELSERGLQSRERRQERILENFRELTAEKEQLNTDITKLTSTIATLRKRVKLLENQEKAARIAAESKPDATPTPAPKAVVKATPVPTPTPEPEPIEIVSEDEGVTTETAAMATDKETAQKEDSVTEESLSPRQRYARLQMRKLNELTLNADKSENRRYTELLMEVDRDQVIELEYLGNDQFYAEVKLQKGKHKLLIRLRKFVVTIPNSADNDTFVVIYDARDKGDEHFVFFNKKLLN